METVEYMHPEKDMHLYRINIMYSALLQITIIYLRQQALI